MPAAINVNGRVTDARDAVVPVLDHGFLYGEGIYETMRTYHRRLFLFDRHMRRMRHSAEMIALTLPFTPDALTERIGETMAAARLGDAEAHIRVLVTRGVGEITYDLAATPTPSVVIIVKPHVDPPAGVYARGVRVVLLDIVRNHPGSVNPAIKCNNLMNSALGMQEAIRKGAFEGIMRNYRGELAECTTANLFVVSKGVVRTPPLEAGLLAGTRREFVFDLGQELGIDVREAVLTDEDLYGADEAFLTSTTREAVPIVEVGDRTIGSGRPGPVTGALLEAFRRHAWAD